MVVKEKGEFLNRQSLSYQLQKNATQAYTALNHFLLIIPAGTLLLLLFCLFFYSSHGFDITDDSYYLLWASQPEHVLASYNPFGFYTKLLYVLSGENIAVFRSLGVLVLLAAAGLFSISLERYWMSLSGLVLNTRRRLLAIVLILTGSLVYYQLWLLTPSYNWLALTSILFCASGLLRFAAHSNGEFNRNHSKSLLVIDGLLVGGGGGIAFMAKPTTSVLLALTTLYWVVVHPLHSRWKSFLGVALFTACSILLAHAFLLKGGVIAFYVELREGVELVKLLGAGHSMMHVFSQTLTDVKQMPSRVFSVASVGFLITPILLPLLVWLKKRGRENVVLYILSFFLTLFFLTTCYQLCANGQWARMAMGVSGLAIVMVLLTSAMVAMFSSGNRGNGIGNMSFWRLGGLCFFLFLLAGSFAFGSGNGFLKQMSGAYVFYVAGALYTGFWIDQLMERDILGYIVPAMLSVSVFLVLLDAYNTPYRLTHKINEQNIKVTFLSGKGSLLVDSTTAQYINELKKVALQAGWILDTPLIDLTGGSPGAIVVLDGRITGFPWLIGGYKGSEAFAETSVGMISKEEQRSAWVLTSPGGRREISSKILVNIGLGFPQDYKKVGELRTGYRDEVQILWKPLWVIKNRPGNSF